MRHATSRSRVGGPGVVLVLGLMAVLLDPAVPEMAEVDRALKFPDKTRL
ncbi:hypothetical protein OG429_30445 [Streptomyces sp. NBC_00190]|nr:hypothetical protein [Streptomyces sp. NBC_00190]WSZ43232.1 hypothetical protein OG239_33060 [Streptomyces sp. NBC_00868]